MAAKLEEMRAAPKVAFFRFSVPLQDRAALHIFVAPCPLPGSATSLSLPNQLRTAFGAIQFGHVAEGWPKRISL